MGMEEGLRLPDRYCIILECRMEKEGNISVRYCIVWEEGCLPVWYSSEVGKGKGVQHICIQMLFACKVGKGKGANSFKLKIIQIIAFITEYFSYQYVKPQM